MAVERVLVKLGNNEVDLQNQSGDIYTGGLPAPKEYGLYPLEVKIYDNEGKTVFDSSTIIEVSEWQTPKTDWIPNDRFIYIDYNRIKNNLLYVYQKAVELWGEFDIEDMGPDKKGYKDRISARSINTIERNLDAINQHVLTQDFGFSKTFFSNEPFIDANELNRIESATLQIKKQLDRHEASLSRLPFTLGRFKEIRI